MIRARARWSALLREPWLVYAVGVVLFSGLALLSWPIVAGDTDLWYHLTGGRYILEHRALPTESFFSFLSPPRPWVDYYWGFQALVSTLYRWGGYPALIVLRAILYLVTAGLILHFFFAGRDRRTPLPWLVFLVLSVCPFLLLRWLGVRPHLFSYLFIVTFIWILERHPRAAWGLPVLGLAWCNLHGVVYPVMLLIVGAYGLEALMACWRAPADRARQARRLLLPLAATMATVFLTPHGWRLLSVPFVSTAGASRYIAELQPYRLYDALSFSLTFLTPSHLTIFNVCLAVISVSVLVACLQRPRRLSHLLLAVGGLALLSKGIRFTYECLLLSLPLVRAAPLIPTTHLAKRVAKPVYLVGAGVLLLLPLNFLLSVFHNPPAYPLGHRRLPLGIVAFLDQAAAGGTVLNHPNSGGYLEWALFPRYRIFMDMQIPFLFTDEDMFLAQRVFTDADAFERVTTAYRPMFVSVSNDTKAFPKVIEAFSDYVLVFFDDVEALYVDRVQAPALAQRYRVTALDPFTVVDQAIPKWLEEIPDRAVVVRELQRLLAIDPRCALTNQLAAELFLDEQAYDRALPLADAMRRSYPDYATGYRLSGDARKGLRQFQQALEVYQAAMGRAEPSQRPRLYQKIGQVYLEQQQYAKAYRLLKTHVDLFSPETPIDVVFSLGVAARLAGSPDDAKRVLTYLARHGIGPTRAAWAQRVDQELARLDAGR